ncbi:hypothetical protein R3P38DRAFT_2887671 [Favolaschia claudopus]|uniref:Secreted protein n=1 Tax=Favolaschia claudopus TaxID=2862362 RepID=A0AAW0CYF7_9AGAR
MGIHVVSILLLQTFIFIASHPRNGVVVRSRRPFFVHGGLSLEHSPVESQHQLAIGIQESPVNASPRAYVLLFLPVRSPRRALSQTSKRNLKVLALD